MTLESTLAAVKSALAAVTGPEPDPQADRATVLQDLHLAEKAWASDYGASHSWFSRADDHVAFTPTTRNGAGLTIGGKTTNFISAESFADYLRNMRAAIEQGVFDREIAAALHGSANVGGTAEVALPPQPQGDAAQNRRMQQDASLRHEGRNSDGSLKVIFGDR